MFSRRLATVAATLTAAAAAAIGLLTVPASATQSATDHTRRPSTSICDNPGSTPLGTCIFSGDYWDGKLQEFPVGTLDTTCQNLDFPANSVYNFIDKDIEFFSGPDCTGDRTFIEGAWQFNNHMVLQMGGFWSVRVVS